MVADADKDFTFDVESEFMAVMPRFETQCK